MPSAPIVLAGASGDLGTRILAALIARRATVRALLRPDAGPDAEARVRAGGATIVRADALDPNAISDACEGAACVVSALNGLRDVIVDRQSVLLAGAVRAQVPRFIPSDYAADFTRTAPGRNRNFDFRREFMRRLDEAPIRATSILNGAFMDMLGAEMPIVQAGIHRVLYWGSQDQVMNFTTKDDVAAYVAAAALDDTTPRILRIAGDSLSARALAEVLTGVTGERYRTLRVGVLGLLSAMIAVAKVVAPQPEANFPPWQGMQYLRDMFSGDAALYPLDNGRYSELRWTTVRDMMTARKAAA